MHISTCEDEIECKEISNLTNMCEVTSMDRVRNEKVQRKIDVVRELTDWAEQNIAMIWACGNKEWDKNGRKD